MTESIAGKRVLITGASSGIGSACAETFAGAGASLILWARRENRLQTLSAELQSKYGIQCQAGRVDVTDRHAVKDAFEHLPETWQTIDILINNAGLSRTLDKAWDVPVADVDAMIDTNVKGLLNVTRVVVPGMIKRGIGHIINLGSIAGHENYPGGSVYCASKAAERALSRGLKIDLLGTPLRVSSIDPGMVETEFSLVRFNGDQKQAKAVYQGMNPLTAFDIADVILFVATRPPHVNISEILVLPTDQSMATQVYRRNS
ncbi:SDR family NAD(P)-dependent oxidoreductase [Candidatus Neomarinimicrobiota bacterium]